MSMYEHSDVTANFICNIASFWCYITSPWNYTKTTLPFCITLNLCNNHIETKQILHGNRCNQVVPTYSSDITQFRCHFASNTNAMIHLATLPILCFGRLLKMAAVAEVRDREVFVRINRRDNLGNLKFSKYYTSALVSDNLIKVL